MGAKNQQRRRVLQGLLALPVVASLPMAGRLLAGEDEASLPGAPGSGADSVVVTLHASPGPRRLDAELATSAAQRRRGLMERDSLARDAGMLFVYPQLADSSFWMYRTRIALDIAFIDARGRITEIRTMQPCISDSPQECPHTQPASAYRAALEVNAGYFARHGIAPGDCVSWSGDGGGQCRQASSSDNGSD